MDLKGKSKENEYIVLWLWIQIQDGIGIYLTSRLHWQNIDTAETTDIQQ